MVKTAFAIAFNPAARAQMRAEVKAQFAAFAATGLRLDHVNAHKHFHMHPMITSAILDAGRDLGIPAMRVPVEHGAPGFGPAAMRWWAGLLGRRLRARGIAVNDCVVGLAQTGAFTPGPWRRAGRASRWPDRTLHPSRHRRCLAGQRPCLSLSRRAGRAGRAGHPRGADGQRRLAAPFAHWAAAAQTQRSLR
jgi:hypothetical protein